jgi:hypothetical protein
MGNRFKAPESVLNRLEWDDTSDPGMSYKGSRYHEIGTNKAFIGGLHKLLVER